MFLDTSSDTVKIISFELDKTQGALSFNLNSTIGLIILGVVIIILIIAGIRTLISRSKRVITFEDIELNIPFELGSFKVARNYANLEIANRIYIELTTRKAALTFDDRYDVIDEVYDSWYVLFKTLREEVKKLPGKLLFKKSPSVELIELTSTILNEGLRPHLTKYQAVFRKWYQEALNAPENKNKTPRAIQEKFKIDDEEFNYAYLVNDIKNVNTLLKIYAEKLREFIYG